MSLFSAPRAVVIALTVAGLVLPMLPAAAQPVPVGPSPRIEPVWTQVDRQLGGRKESAVAIDHQRGLVYVATAVGRQSMDPLGASDIALVTYAESDGTRLRARTYGGAFNSTRDQSVAVEVDVKSGTVYLTGRLGVATASGTVPVIVTLAYGRSSTPLWVQTYRSNSPAMGATPLDMVRDPGTGNIYVSGAAGDGTAVTLAYDAVGALLWRATGRPGTHTSVAVDDGTGTVYVAGTTRRPDDTTRLSVTARNPSGAELWTYTSDTDSRPEHIAVDTSTGSAYVLTATDGSPRDFVTLRLSAQGEQVWRTIYDTGADDVPTDLVVNPVAGQVVIAGTSYGPDPATEGDYITVAYDTDGAKLWSRAYRGCCLLVDVVGAIAVDVERGVYHVTGSSEVDSYRRRDYDILANTETYTLTGQRIRDDSTGTFNLRYFPESIVVDPQSGRVVIAGPTQTRFPDNPTWGNFVLAYN